jgi:TolB protein
VKKWFATAVLTVVLVTMLAGIVLAYVAPMPHPPGAATAAADASACGPAVAARVERSLDHQANRLAWSTGPRVGSWQIVIADPDGTHRAPLTAGDTFQGDPAWSPDGTRVAYVQRDADENDYLWLADADGANPRLLVKGASTPAWSPDGTRIAYWSGSNGGLWVLELATGQNVSLVKGGDDLGMFDDHGLLSSNIPSHAPWGRPAWSPDGTRVVFQVIGPEINSDLASVTVGERRIERITDTPGCDERHPAWTPDGERIVFVGDPSDGTPTDLFAVDPDGTDRERLTATDDRSEESPAISPDGRTIAVAFTFANGATFGIRVLNADGSGAQDVSRTSPADASGMPAWVP